MPTNVTRRTVLAALAAGMIVPKAWAGSSFDGWSDQILPLQYEPERRVPPVMTGISISSTHRLLAGAGDDHLVRVWNIDTGELAWLWNGHTDWVRTLEFEPGGLVLASAGNDRRIVLWNVEDGHELHAFPQLPGSIGCLKFNHLGDLLAATGYDAQLTFLRWRERTMERSLACPCQDMRALAFSPDDRLLAGGGRNGKVRIWSTETGEVVREYAAHRQRIRGITFSTNGKRVVTVSEDQTIVSAPVDGSTVDVIARAPAKLLCSAVLDDYLVTGCADNAIRVWELEGGTLEAELQGHTGSVAAVTTHEDTIYSGSYDTTVRRWRLGSPVDAPTRR